MKKNSHVTYSPLSQSFPQMSLPILMPYELEWFEFTGNDIDLRQVMRELHEDINPFTPTFYTEE